MRIRKMYRYVDNFDLETGNQKAAIKIVKGNYKGIVYDYGRMAFSPEDKKTGKKTMIFDYNIRENPENIDIEESDFVDLLGDILVDMLSQK